MAENKDKTHTPTNDEPSADADAIDSALAENAEPMASEAEELKAQLDEAKDRALRLQADWENYRKRARRELDEERRYADLKLLTDLLPVLDNMQRAIEAASTTTEGASLLEGFKLVKQQLDNVLSQHHCTRIDALGKPFDPHLHEAVMQQTTTEHAPHTVLGVARDGYLLFDRVIRPAQVIVSAPTS
ncbi:MAG: nucleotide exchange factor GrpE [Planctomycetia bacterium]|nr:nucleotide exchange factor GrpE [Planctomycetia bacterium]